MRTPPKKVQNEVENPAGRLKADLYSLPEEAFSQDLSVDEVTWPEDAMRAATVRSQGFRAADVSSNKRRLFGRIWPRRLTRAVTAPGIEALRLVKDSK